MTLSEQIKVHEHLRTVFANFYRQRGIPLAYGVDIYSSTTEDWSRCYPLFETEEEAKAYGPWLAKRNKFVRSWRARWTTNPVNARFDVERGELHIEGPADLLKPGDGEAVA